MWSGTGGASSTTSTRESRSVEVEEVMARFTFGMTCRPKKHLVPLPRQQETKKESSKSSAALFSILFATSINCHTVWMSVFFRGLYSVFDNYYSAITAFKGRSCSINRNSRNQTVCFVPNLRLNDRLFTEFYRFLTPDDETRRVVLGLPSTRRQVGHH